MKETTFTSYLHTSMASKTPGENISVIEDSYDHIDHFLFHLAGKIKI
jgi:hypothetical protein